MEISNATLAGTAKASCLREKLYHIHVNDNNGVVGQGLIPGQEVLDYQPFIRALREIGYKGYLSLELSFNCEQNPDSAAHKAKRFMDNVLKTSESPT